MNAATATAFDALDAHAATLSTQTISGLFLGDPQRFERFSAQCGDLLLDFSKCLLDETALSLLLSLARAAGVEAARDAMMAGAPINNTERRAALHTALRRNGNTPLKVNDEDIVPGIRSDRALMSALAQGIRSGAIRGATGEAFTDVVNLGIGGSDLGPEMTVLALKPYHDGPRLHFVANVDGAHLADTLSGLDPARTLFIIASKTFTTIETMTNAKSARAWIAGALGEGAIGDHFAAVTTALEKAAAFPVRPDRIVGFRDWVGGRYSIWSAIGLPLEIAIGAPHFDAFLAGASAMDRHFVDAPLAENLPVLLGLIGIWHRNVADHPTRALIPYDQRLKRFPAYVQQLDMESNGKRVGRNGAPLKRSSGPIVWGEPGTNAQHAFFQLLHQGTDVVPVEFLIAAEGHEPAMRTHHDLLIANCLAQSEALMRGRTLAEAHAQLIAMGRSAAEAEALAPHRVFPGNRPSLTLAYPRLTPDTLGALIALYEHRVFVEAAIWGLNPFDQWGVELGKELATALLPTVTGTAASDAASASTLGLAAWLRTPKR